MSLLDDLRDRWQQWNETKKEKLDETKDDARGCASCLVGIASLIGIVVFGLLTFVIPFFVVPFLFCVLSLYRSIAILFYGDSTSEK